jgi:TRAP-type mannitol/chloroaromatic compound transport system permease small subunit
VRRSKPLFWWRSAYLLLQAIAQAIKYIAILTGQNEIAQQVRDETALAGHSNFE